MEVQSLLIEAIEKRKSIKFEYHSPTDDVKGFRIGNPHALYNLDPKSKSKSVLYLDLWQTGGVSQSGKINVWKQYIVKYMFNISILYDEQLFQIAPYYRPNSDKYKKSIYLI
jgi:hypothetical protein